MGREHGIKVHNKHGPYDDARHVCGVTYDGVLVWVACGSELLGTDPDSGEVIRRLSVPAGAGTAFDGTHLYQTGEGRIRKIELRSGEVVHSIPVPPGGTASGLTWAEGFLWLGKFREGKILKLDPETGEVLGSIETPEYVTGVAWADGSLWHGVDPPNRPPSLRRIDPDTGQLLESHELPASMPVTGVAVVGDRFFCGGGNDKQVRELVREEG
ncbi:MAG: glutaminyl-peptide cyclotransferase [Nannocystaceae bacterium]|nr:glutaminyl-peptide cyclotransferase [Nannocystaceae bacterium]